MNICLVGLENLPVLAREYNKHGIGGEQVQQTLLAKALSKRGYNISMVIGDYGQPDAAIWDSITTYKAYKPDAGLPVIRFIYPRWTGIWSALKKADADVYYTSCAGMMVGLMAMFCRVHGRGLVFRLAHDTDADPDQLLIRYRRDKWLYGYGLRRANEVLSQHGFQQAALLKNYGVASVVADMLVDPPTGELVLSERDVPVLWVNNLRDFKRPELALELARRLPCRQIHMVGGPQSSFHELYETTERESAALPNLSFHGRIPYHNVGDFYDRARVFVNTSDSEGFPNSYLQSWRRGVPVVAFFDPGGLIRREGLGYAVSGMDEMQQAVEKLLTDDDEWQRISARCRAYMERHHGDDAVLEPYLTAIEQAYSARRPA
jgi:glycosyltransferase involved in cell wall biosynthesis